MDILQRIYDKFSFRTFRSFWYALTPSEMTYSDISSVPHMFTDYMGWITVFIVLEVLVMWKKQYKDAWDINNSLCSLALALMENAMYTAFRTGALAAYCWVYDNYYLGIFPWQSIWMWFGALITVDFLYYWLHRAAHEVNILWALHHVHHSNEYFNIPAGIRVGCFEKVVGSFAYVPAAFIIPPQAFVAHLTINTLSQLWVHCFVIGKLGPIGWVFNTPSYHRVHHGRNPYCIDKNYGGYLMFWDRLFGTFQEELDEEPVAYGSVDKLDSINPMYIQYHYFKEHIWKKARTVAGLPNKLKAIFYGPGWEPGKPRLGNFAEIPQVEQPVRMFKQYVPRWVTVYMVCHGIVIALSMDYISANYSVRKLKNEVRLSLLFIWSWVILARLDLAVMSAMFDCMLRSFWHDKTFTSCRAIIVLVMPRYDYWWHTWFIFFSSGLAGFIFEMKWYAFYIELGRLAFMYQFFYGSILPVDNRLNFLIHVGFATSAYICVGQIFSNKQKWKHSLNNKRG